MLTPRRLFKAFDLGDIETVYKEVRRYGVIVTDKEWEMTEPARYAGAWRNLWINHHGRGWEFTLHNGELTEAGHVFAPVIIGIHGTAVTEEQNARDIRIRDYKPE